MDVIIRDKNALTAVSPAALSAYARGAGWRKTEPYRGRSDVYVAERQPDVIIPRSTDLGDYASTVLALIDVFAEVGGQSTLEVYRELLTADCDVVRVRVPGGDGGNLPVATGVGLLSGARDMMFAAACAVDEKPPFSRAATRTARDFLRDVRLGEMGYGSFAISLLGPALSRSSRVAGFRGSEDGPFARRVTRRLLEALGVVRGAADEMARGHAAAFRWTVGRGVSASLCRALGVMIRAAGQLEVGLLWARTHSMLEARAPVRFVSGDAPRSPRGGAGAA